MFTTSAPHPALTMRAGECTMCNACIKTVIGLHSAVMVIGNAPDGAIIDASYRQVTFPVSDVNARYGAKKKKKKEAGFCLPLSSCDSRKLKRTSNGHVCEPPLTAS